MVRMWCASTAVFTNKTSQRTSYHNYKNSEIIKNRNSGVTRTMGRGSIVYTDRYRGRYDALIFCVYRHVKIDHKKCFARGKVYINGVEAFWSFAKERLIKFHGISKEKFPLYLKEMEFRYNNRNKPLLPVLVQYLCDLVANRL